MIKTFKNEKSLARNLALEILKQLKKRRRLVLGCPGGRSLKKTYYYLGQLSYELNISLDQLTIIMMDEYVEKILGQYKLVNPSCHYSCVRFSKQVIKRLLNYKKTHITSLKVENILFPNIENPKAYDSIIKKLGGIDIFLLASGSSDGHVAFNNAYSNLSQKTHITKLSIKTRTDNMKTFTNFVKLNEVPKYGLTVGLKTISFLTRKAILVLTGEEKKEAFRKIKELNKFDVVWPASIIFKCRNYNIYTNLLDNYQK
jgi:glucosamine-6-phosphate deaminase